MTGIICRKRVGGLLKHYERRAAKRPNGGMLVHVLKHDGASLILEGRWRVGGRASQGVQMRLADIVATETPLAY